MYIYVCIYIYTFIYIYVCTYHLIQTRMNSSRHTHGWAEQLLCQSTDESRTIHVTNESCQARVLSRMSHPMCMSGAAISVHSQTNHVPNDFCHAQVLSRMSHLGHEQLLGQSTDESRTIDVTNQSCHAQVLSRMSHPVCTSRAAVSVHYERVMSQMNYITNESFFHEWVMSRTSLIANTSSCVDGRLFPSMHQHVTSRMSYGTQESCHERVILCDRRRDLLHL